MTAWNDSGKVLGEACPALSTKYAYMECPSGDSCNWIRQGYHVGRIPQLAEIIIHLNDTHHWARAASDYGVLDEVAKRIHLPNIADWLDEYAAERGLDLRLLTPEEQEKKRQADRDSFLTSEKLWSEGGPVPEPCAVDMDEFSPWLDKVQVTESLTATWDSGTGQLCPPGCTMHHKDIKKSVAEKFFDAIKPGIKVSYAPFGETKWSTEAFNEGWEQ